MVDELNMKRVPAHRFPEFQNDGEWEDMELGDVGPVSMCKRIMKEQTNLNYPIPFYKIGTFGKDADAFISEKLYNEYKENYSFPSKGDILISAAGTIGRTVEYDGLPAYFQDSNIVWIANDESVVLNSFLKYLYSLVKWRIDDGGVVKRLYNESIRQTHIIVPSRSEQRKIANCLFAMDNLILISKNKLKLLKLQKDGVMRKLFPVAGKATPEIRFKEFEKDGKWRNVFLKDIIHVNSGRDYKHLDVGNIPVYGTGGYMLSVNQKLSDVDAVGIGRKGTIDKPQFLKAPFWTVDTLFFLTVKDCVAVEFLFYLTQMIPWKKYGEQTGVPSMSKKSIENIEVLIPSVFEQRKIARFLSLLDSETEMLLKRINFLETCKKGLVQQIFPTLY